MDNKKMPESKPAARGAGAPMQGKRITAKAGPAFLNGKRMAVAKRAPMKDAQRVTGASGAGAPMQGKRMTGAQGAPMAGKSAKSAGDMRAKMFAKTYSR
jgi:hypothetical protein